MDINYLAVFTSGLVSMIIGSLWYGPLFGKAWIRLIGFSQEQIDEAKKKGMAKSYAAMFVSALVTAGVLALLVGAMGASTFVAGAIVGFWAWLGFVAPVLLGSVLWESKPVQLWVLNVGHYLVAYVVIGGILAVWQ